MNIIWSPAVDLILSKGLSLKEIGINNWALTKDQALKAIDHLALEDISILGGDVLRVDDGIIEHTLDNWHCDHLAGEEIKAFVQRSLLKARDYITNYKIHTGEDVLFSIVPNIDRVLT